MVRARRTAAALVALGALPLAAAPMDGEIEPEVRWTTGGLRPARTYQKVLEPREPDYARAMAERIPMHMDPLDLRSRETFGAGVIEIGEAIKRAVSEEASTFRAGFETGPYEVGQVLVASRAPNFFPHDYGLGFRLRVTIRGVYRSSEDWHEPVDFPVDLDVLVGEGGLVRADMRVDWDTSPEAQGGAPDELREHLLAISRHVANAYGPLELQGMEALVRDRIRATLFEPPQGRPRVNPVFAERYVPLALQEAEVPLDLADAGGLPYPDGKPDAAPLRIVNRLRRIERGPLERGGRPRFDFQGHAGWEIWRGDEKVLAGPEGRIKFALVGDTDGDWIPDLVLVEDRARRRFTHDPYHPVHRVMLRPAIYFLDGQDMVRGVFDLGPPRFDFPPGADGSEIRRVGLVPRTLGGEARDWDVSVEVFDPLGRVFDEAVFDRYPANRRSATDVGYQRAEFAGPPPPGSERGVKLRVYFPLNSAELTAEERRRLEDLWEERVGADQVLRGTLVGHTCRDGSYAHNVELGLRRARTVASFLAGKGVRPAQLEVESRGEYDPIASNATMETAKLNRRVDGWLVVRPAPRGRAPWYGRVGAPHDRHGDL